MKYTVLIFLVAAVIASFTSALAADNKPFSPWDFGKSPSVSENRSKEGNPRSGRIMSGVMGFYSKYISAVDGDRCSMYPNCSLYSAQAFRKHGAVIGAVMTADRLIHEADESGLAPKVNVNGRVLNYDPVSNNDFWWKGEDRSGFDKQ